MTELSGEIVANWAARSNIHYRSLLHFGKVAGMLSKVYYGFMFKHVLNT